MKDERKTKKQLIDELIQLRQRIEELEAATAGRAEKVLQAARDDLEGQVKEGGERRNYKLALLNRAGRAFNSTLDLDQVLATILQETCSLLGATAASIWLHEYEGDQELVCRQATGPRSEVVRGWRLAAGEGIAGWVAQHGESLIVPDTHADRRYFGGVDEETGLALRSILSVPLWAKKHVIGTIQVVDSESGRFDKADLALLEPLAATAAIAIENARLYEALQESEIKFRSLVEYSDDGIILLDKEGTIVEWNQGQERLSGLRRDEVLGQSIWDVQFWMTPEGQRLPEVYDRLQAQALKLFEMEPGSWPNQLLENEIQRPDGVHRVVQSLAFPIQADTDVKIGSITRDITERVRSEAIRIHVEKTLRAEKERTQLYLDVAGVAIIAFDREGRVTLINERGLDILGYREEELVGERWVDVCLPKRVRDEVAGVFGAVIAGDVELVQYRENAVLTKGGEERIIAWHNAALHDAAGDIVGILSSGEDITERKRAEDALRASEARLKSTIESLPFDFFALDENGRYVLQNSVCKRRWGHLIGERPEDSAPNDNVRAQWQDNNRRAFAGETVKGEVEYTQEGETRFYHNVISPVYAGDRVRGVVGVNIDITERKRAETILALRADQLAALSRASQIVTASLDLDQVLAEIVALASEVVDTDYTSVVLMDGSGHLGQSVEDLPGVPALEHRIRDEGFTNWIAHSRQPMIVDAIEEDGTLHPEPAEGAPRQANPPIVEAGIKSLAGLPLMAKEHLLGVLYLHSLHPGAFRDQLSLLTAFANQAAIAIENARLFEAAQYELAERKRMQEDLRVSEERLRGILSSLHETAVVAYDREGRHLSVWGALEAAEQRGIPLLEDVLGRLVTEVFPPEIGQAALADIRQVFETGEAVRREIALSLPDSVLWQDVTLSPMRGPSGEVSAVIGVIHDITERKQAEKALQQYTERLRILHTIDEAILSAWSPEELARVALRLLHKLMPCERAGIATFDFESDEAIVLGVYPGENAFPPGTRFPLKGLAELESLRSGRVLLEADLSPRTDPPPAIQAMLAAGIQQYVAAPLISLSGLMGALIIVPQDSPTQQHADIASEVASQIAVAMDQARLRAALQAEQKRLKTLVEHLPEGVLLLDGDRRILLANPAVEEYLHALAGNGSTVCAGQVLDHLGEWPATDLVHISAEGLWQELEIAGPPRRIFGMAAQPIKAEKRTEGWVLLIWDVTHEREIERRNRQQERLAAVGQLAGGVAHDFNNLLTTILLYAQMLLHKPHLPTDLAPNVETIIEESQRAARLVQQILDFSRRAMMETRPVDLSSFVHETTDILRRTFPENIRISVELEGGERTIPFTVKVDPTRIQQMVMNLALNGRDAMLEGGELCIGLSCIEVGPGEEPPVADMLAGKWICLAVSDTGTGIPPDVLPHIYEPFFTTKPTGEGTGLGLAQVYGIVKQHGGYIDIETAVGAGTTFRVYLPFCEAEAEENIQEAPALPKGNGETILLVEDEDSLKQIGHEMLESLGYRVLTAADGEEALQVYRSAEKIDLVVTDLVMPKMGGQELVRELRKTAPCLKALGITGYALKTSKRELEETGILDIVQKPFDISTFGQLVRQVLDEDQ